MNANTSQTAIYQRILLKLSGEALRGQQPSGLDSGVLQRVATEVADLARLGVEIAIVVGGGNFLRGADLVSTGIDRVTGDQMAMLATMMNALALRDAIESAAVPAKVMSAIAADGLIERFNAQQARRDLAVGRVLLFAGGTGNPLVTTDSAASLRAVEMKADILLKATQVDGIYSADPKQDATATLYSQLSYRQVLEKELAVMDIAAFYQCRDFKMPIRVFNINQPGLLHHLVMGGHAGTIVQE